MVEAQVPQRKRRCHLKVKTGCGTCRVRRIKCDEARPDCKRCSTTGRKCDGYSTGIISFQTPKDSMILIQQISTHIPGDAEEKRGFDFFLRNTAAELSGYYDPSFWERCILAASAQKPFLRHALIAIGALHESFSRKTKPSEGDQFALKQYAKAVKSLRRSLATGKEEPVTALMSCVLFVCFNSLRGWFESAMIHLRSGLRILRDIRQLFTRDDIIDHHIAPLFRRLSIQSIVYVDTKIQHDQTAFAGELADVSEKEAAILEEFENLESARNGLNQAADGLFRAFYMWNEDLPIYDQPVESLEIFDKYKTQLSLWNISFEKFVTAKSTVFSSKEVRGAALLKIHYTTAKIMCSVLPDINDMRAVSEAINASKFFKHCDDFQIIVNLSRSLIAAAEMDMKNGKSPLSFSSDMGLVAPLYYTCINCQTFSIRTAAMELLLRCPRREGMWNSVLVARMIQEYWELEANHKVAQDMGLEVDEYGFPVPFTDRGVVHFSYFGRPEESSVNGVPQFPPPDICFF